MIRFLLYSFQASVIMSSYMIDEWFCCFWSRRQNNPYFLCFSFSLFLYSLHSFEIQLIIILNGFGPQILLRFQKKRSNWHFHHKIRFIYLNNALFLYFLYISSATSKWNDTLCWAEPTPLRKMFSLKCHYVNMRMPSLGTNTGFI